MLKVVRKIHYKLFLHINELTDYLNNNNINLNDVKILNAHECYVLLYKVTTIDEV